MDVKITNYGSGETNFVDYLVSGLSKKQLNFLDAKIEEKTSIVDDDLLITCYFDDELYPFQSEVAHFRLDDFISREEIEMNVFLSSFLEDMV